MVSTAKKVKLTFVLGTDLRTGRGTENTTLNYIKYAPSKFEVRVLETDFLPEQRISDTKISSLTKHVKILKMHVKRDKFTKILLFSTFKPLVLIRRLFLDPKLPVTDIKKLKSQQPELYKIVRDTDVAYLVANEYAPLFEGLDIPVIGSNHCWEPSWFFGERPTMKERLIRRANLKFFRYINGFHFFPRNRIYINKMKRRYNVTLPNGIDVKRFRPTTKKHKRIRFLFVANLSRRKGLKTVLDAWDLINDKTNAELHIAGSGPTCQRASTG